MGEGRVKNSWKKKNFYYTFYSLCIKNKKMFELPKLPYEKNALEPYVSQETLEYHYGKHHQGYVNKLNAGIEGTDFAGKSLEEIIKTAKWGIFNNAAQVWNHTFYWNSLTPDYSEPTGKIAELLERDFGGLENFQKAFTNAGASNFASGWTWLVQTPVGELEIVNTDDAETIITTGNTPLLTMDVWEHAYYIDKRNDRGAYIDDFFKLINWEFANKNLAK